MKLVYPAIFKPLEEQEGFCVVFPDLPGCITQGLDLTCAVDNATDAACGWILDELEDGHTIPKISDIKTILLENSEFVSLIVLDMDSYTEKYGENAVRKNCTIPAWLNTIATKENINFSSTLQNALMEQLHIQN